MNKAKWVSMLRALGRGEIQLRKKWAVRIRRMLLGLK